MRALGSSKQEKIVRIFLRFADKGQIVTEGSREGLRVLFRQVTLFLEKKKGHTGQRKETRGGGGGSQVAATGLYIKYCIRSYVAV